MNRPLPDWIYQQSAIMPFRRSSAAASEGDLEVLLVTTRAGKRWTFPKGIVEPGMSKLASAVKEAWEEAGVRGRVGAAPLGVYHREKWGGRCEVTLFPMEVSEAPETWPESGFRKRQWLPLKDAATRLRPQELRDLLADAPAKISRMSLAPFSEAPARLIYLLRHAKSSWTDPLLEDHERPLAPRGLKASEVMASYLRMGDIKPEFVICSTAVRTRQTLTAIQPVLGASVQVRFDDGLYLAEGLENLALLRAQPEALRKVMLIGHNPGLEDLAHLLVGSGDVTARARMDAKFPTAALAILEHRGARWRDLEPGSCALHSFVVPRDFEDDSTL